MTEVETNIVDHKEYIKSRKKLEKFFVGKTFDTATTHFSKLKNYFLTVHRYKTKKGCWNYTRGIVETKDGATLADIKRNYSAFPFLFITHPNGKDYLVCGEDYQGYTIVNLTDETTKTFIPEGWLKGVGFCWASYKFDEENKNLIVDGCYWAFPYETVTYDFSDPDNLPLKELDRKDMEDDDEDDEEE